MCFAIYFLAYRLFPGSAGKSYCTWSVGREWDVLNLAGYWFILRSIAWKIRSGGAENQ